MSWGNAQSFLIFGDWGSVRVVKSPLWSIFICMDYYFFYNDKGDRIFFSNTTMMVHLEASGSFTFHFTPHWLQWMLLLSAEKVQGSETQQQSLTYQKKQASHLENCLQSEREKTDHQSQDMSPSPTVSDHSCLSIITVPLLLTDKRDPALALATDSFSLSAARRCTAWKLLRAAEKSFISRSLWIFCCLWAPQERGTHTRSTESKLEGQGRSHGDEWRSHCRAKIKEAAVEGIQTTG